MVVVSRLLWSPSDSSSRPGFLDKVLPLPCLPWRPSLLPASRVLLGSGFHLTGPGTGLGLPGPETSLGLPGPETSLGLPGPGTSLGLPSSNFEVTIHAEIGAFGTALGDDKLCNLPRIVFGYRHRGIVIKPGMTADSWCFDAVVTHRRARVRMGITISRSQSFNRVRYRTGLRITLSYVLNNAVNTAAGTSIG